MKRFKLLLALLGFGLTLLGVYLDSRPIIWVAIGVLGIAILLRTIIKNKERAAALSSHPE